METSTSSRLGSLSASQVLLFVGLVLSVLLGGTISLDNLRPLSEEVLATLLGSSELPLWQHAFAAVFLCGSLLITMLTRRVVVLPPGKVAIGGFWFLGLLVITCFTSRFLTTSFITTLEWAVYGATFLAAISCLGRTRGPLLAAQVIVVAIAVLALMGIREYGQMKATDPTWRIMAGWMNPNVLAGMLILGFFPALGLAAAGEKPAHKLGWGLAALAIGFALILTQSRGAVISAFGGGVILLLLSLKRGRSLVAVGAIVAALLVGLAMLQSRTAAPVSGPASGASARLANVGATQAQSVGFRVELWKTSLDLMKMHPTGTGPGTFQFTSGEPGRVTKTILAHNSFLQLGAEASFVAPVLLLGVIFLSLWQAIRSRHPERPEASLLVTSIVAGLLAGVANNLQDSHMYHFGYGVTFAALLAVALQLSADGSAPEILPRSLRYSAALGVATLPVLGLAYFGYTEYARATANADSLRSAPIPEGPNFAALAQLDPTNQLNYLERAAQLMPSGKNLRRLAMFHINAGQPDRAIAPLLQARRLEPGDPQVLSLLYQIYREQDNVAARKAMLQAGIASETSTYGQIRSLPELVPTEVAQMRLWESELDPSRGAELRRDAALIFRQYWLRTWPQLRGLPPEMAIQTGYAGERLGEAVDKLKQLQNLVDLLPADAPVDRAQLDTEVSKAESVLAGANGG